MTQIRIDTEQAREVGRRLVAEGDRLAEIGYELERAIGSLDTWAWDGASRWRAEPLLGRVRPEGAQVAQELEELGHKLVRVAEVFEQEDNAAAGSLGDLEWVEFDDGSYVTDLLGAHSKTIEEIPGKLDDAKDILASLGIAAGLVKGSTYEGQTIFHGSHKLKELAGISPYLTHIKVANIPSHMAKQAFKGSLTSRLNLLNVAINGHENWEKYGGEGWSKVASGTIVDSAMDIGLSAAGASLGAWGGAAAGGLFLGTISGGTLAPVGAVIGGKIGGVAGSMAGGWVSDQLKKTDLHDNIVDTGADLINGAADVISDTVDIVRHGIDQSVEKVDQALGSAIDTMVSLF